MDRMQCIYCTRQQRPLSDHATRKCPTQQPAPHRLPNLSDESVSAALSMLGEQQMMRVVRALPPSESWRARVSLLSRNGTWPPILPSVSALTTLPRVLRDLLMSLPSSSVWATALVLSARSDPARSTCRHLACRLIFPQNVSIAHDVAEVHAA